MKALKILALIVAGVVALGAVLLVAALTPAFQTWAVRKVVASRPDLTLNLSHIAVGLSAADLADVHLVKDGMVIDAKRVQARYSAWDYLSRHRVTVHDLNVDGLVVDLSKSASGPSPADAPAPRSAPPRAATAPATAGNAGRPAAFNGMLGQVQLPFDVEISRFAIPGRAILPNAQTATFELRGSDITTGQRGTIDWKADLVNAQPDSAIRTLHSTGTAQLHITTERRVDLAEINALASAEGPKLPSDQIRLQLRAEQPAAGGNEGYTANVATVRGSSPEPLLTMAGQYDAASHEVAGAWNVTVRSEQLAAVLSGLGLPDIALEGAGKFSVRPDMGAVKASGELRGDLARLEKVSPQLAPIGRLHLETKFDGGMAEGVAQLEQFTLEATAANGRRLAQMAVLQRIGYALATKRVTFANARADLARISVQALPLAWAQPFAKSLTIDGGELSLVLAVAAEADGSHVRVTPVEPLQLRDVTVRQGTQELAEQLVLSVKPQADYAPDHLQVQFNDLAVSMPSGDTVNGRIAADITHLSGAPEVAFTTDTRAKFVAALKPYLHVDTGPITVSTQSEGRLAGQTLEFDRSATRVNRATGPLLASLDLRQPLKFNLQNHAITAARPEAEALRIQWGEIPLSWAQALVPHSTFAGGVAGGTISLQLRGLDDFTANSTEPIALRGVSVTMNQQPRLQNVDLTLDLTATKKGPAVAYNVRRLDVRQGAARLVSLAVSGQATLGAKAVGAGKGRLQADLGALMAQPVLASSSGLARGTVDATFEANITQTIDAKATVTARNLAAREKNQPLGDAELQLTAAVQPDGSSQLRVPFTFVNGGRKSDLLIDGRLARSENRISFDGRITSNLLVVDDLKALAALAPGGTPSQSAAGPIAMPGVAGAPGVPAPPPGVPGQPPARVGVRAGVPAASPTSTAARDAKPFWAAFGGKVDIDLRQINYGRDYVISGVRGAAVITPAQLVLNGLEGRLKENPFKASARIDFDAAQSKPYALAALANVTSFDVGAFLQAANPNQQPQLQTRVTVEAKLNGNGNTLHDLATKVYGTFDVAGSQGVLRALSKKGGQAVNLGSGLLGIAGALVQPGGSDTAMAVADLARKLAELPFERFAMHVERGADLNLNIGHIEFLSPDTRIVGSGGIVNQPGVPVQNQPLKVTLSLAGKDNMAFLLNRAGLLSGRQDELGYYTMGTSFTLSGTPANPDSNDLWRIIAEAGIRAAAGRFLGR